MAITILTFGKLCFAAIGLAVGAVTLRSALAERSLGLHALASLAIFVGGMGLVLVPAGMAIGPSSAGWWVAMLGEWTMRAGMVLLSLFVWRVFRPSGVWGAIGAGICAVSLLGSLVWDLTAQAGWWPYDATLPSAHAGQVAMAMPFAWSAVESFGRYRQLGRRIALGLADPILQNRFALWTIATSAFVGICALAGVAAEARAAGSATLADAAQITRGALYLLITAVIWLGMFTPAAWRAHLEARASQA
jgi:hypothetical protein